MGICAFTGGRAGTSSAAGSRGAGSTVSLPTLYGGRSHSSHSNRAYGEPASPTTTLPIHRFPPLNSRFDPEAPNVQKTTPVRRNRLLERPKSFYRLFGFGTDRRSDADTSSGTISWADDPNAPSPVALPHKALALLGIRETAAGFRMPASPKPCDHLNDFEDGELRSRNNRRLPCFSELTYTPLEAPPAPERFYFRPESLCSSFSATSVGTTMTTVTSMAATSPSIRTPEGNGTFSSDSTAKAQDISMLNLDDSDSEEEGELLKSTDVFVGKRTTAPASELPVEIAMRICDFFVTETHQEDLGPYERHRRCPNCDIHTLWALALVSRSWNKAATQPLYRTVSLDFGYYSGPTRDEDGKGIAPEFIPYTTCRGDGGTTLHTKIDIQVKLQLLYRTIWDSQGDIGQRIRGIKLPRRLFSIAKYPLSPILQKCPNLEFVDHAIASGTPEDLVSTLSNLTQMKRWIWKREAGVKYEQAKVRQKRMTAMVDMQKNMPGPPLGIALTVFPLWTKLRHLELNNLRREDIPDEFDFCALHSLESVALCNICIIDQNPEAGFLERLPALRRLKIEMCLFISEERIFAYLQQKGHKMTHLELRNSAMPMHTLYRLLASTPSIVHFSISNAPPVPPFSGPDLPTGFTPTLPRLPALKQITVDMNPLRQSFGFLLSLIEDREKTPRLETMRMGFDAAGKRIDLSRNSRAMDVEEMRMEVRLRTECLFGNVQLRLLE